MHHFPGRILCTPLPWVGLTNRPQFRLSKILDPPLTYNKLATSFTPEDAQAGTCTMALFNRAIPITHYNDLRECLSLCETTRYCRDIGFLPRIDQFSTPGLRARGMWRTLVVEPHPAEIGLRHWSLIDHRRKSLQGFQLGCLWVALRLKSVAAVKPALSVRWTKRCCHLGSFSYLYFFFQ